MEGLAPLLNSLSKVVTPILDFIMWANPIKIYRVPTGSIGVMQTFGCVREWNSKLFRSPEFGPGIVLATCFQELLYDQSEGLYIDIDSQTINTSDHKLIHINSGVQYSIANMEKALLRTDEFGEVLQGICMNEIREYSIMHTYLDLVKSDKITRQLTTKINRKIRKYGAVIDKIIITDIYPHDVRMICDTVEESLKNIGIQLTEKENVKPT